LNAVLISLPDFTKSLAIFRPVSSAVFSKLIAPFLTIGIAAFISPEKILPSQLG